MHKRASQNESIFEHFEFGPLWANRQRFSRLLQVRESSTLALQLMTFSAKYHGGLCAPPSSLFPRPSTRAAKVDEIEHHLMSGYLNME
jgi:hypothetical protein